MYGTVALGRLHVEKIDVPENLQSGDLFFIDPACLHQVTFANRERDSEAVVVVL